MCRAEVYRLEKSEERDTITLTKLREAAEALGCELVYAVVPVRGSLEDLAEEVVKKRRRRLKEKPKRGEKGDPYGLVKTIRTVLALTEWHQG